MNDIPITKKIFKLDIQTFITICVFVFGLGISWATIMNGQSNLSIKQDTILASLDKIEKSQEKTFSVNAEKHEEYEKKFAFIDNRINPTVEILAKRAGLK